MNKFLDIVIPRFIEEKVAVVILENGDYQPICCIKDLREDDDYDDIVTVSSFNFFGLSLFPRLVDG